MRTHAQIIADAGGHHGLTRSLLPNLPDQDEVTLRKRVLAWARTDSIPGEYWSLLAHIGIAPMDELTGAAARRKNIPITANDPEPSEKAA